MFLFQFSVLVVLTLYDCAAGTRMRRGWSLIVIKCYSKTSTSNLVSVRAFTDSKGYWTIVSNIQWVYTILKGTLSQRIKDMILSFPVNLPCNKCMGERIFGVVDSAIRSAIRSPIHLLHCKVARKDKIMSFILILFQ